MPWKHSPWHKSAANVVKTSGNFNSTIFVIANAAIIPSLQLSHMQSTQPTDKIH